jgi:hypothetical protein
MLRPAQFLRHARPNRRTPPPRSRSAAAAGSAPTISRRSAARATASSPLRPSTITRRDLVGTSRATSAIRAPGCSRARADTHSAPARVFPKPRPAIITHTRQSFPPAPAARHALQAAVGSKLAIPADTTNRCSRAVASSSAIRHRSAKSG